MKLFLFLKVLITFIYSLIWGVAVKSTRQGRHDRPANGHLWGLEPLLSVPPRGGAQDLRLDGNFTLSYLTGPGLRLLILC